MIMYAGQRRLDATLEANATCTEGVGIALDGVDDYVSLRGVELGGENAQVVRHRRGQAAGSGVRCRLARSEESLSSGGGGPDPGDSAVTGDD